MKNPYKYVCTDKKADTYTVKGPGIPRKGCNILICDEQTAKETVDECFKIYLAGYKAGEHEGAQNPYC